MFLKKARFELKKLITNSTELQKYFKERENHRSETETCHDVPYLDSLLSADVNNSKRVLGIEWVMGNDEFAFCFKKITELAESLEITIKYKCNFL